ncbi:MAG: hypothetical protein A2030_11280 [Chloroflexi bacterium RBG_19FT_COMBO_50_10]|nr:MAG: hypothetical protein A2030_11280 [Chloroflexi bacterium RBG_19FT_COMBO_50_10]
MNKIKRFSVPICLALLGIGILLLGAWDMQRAAAAPRPEAWLPATSLPEPLAANLVQCIDMPESFFMVGGILEGNNTSDKLSRYDINAPGWVELAELPAPRRAVAAACYQGKIYVAGGMGGEFWIWETLFIYDILSNSWTSGPDLPDPVWGAAMGAWDGKLYLVGGNQTGDPYYTPVSRVDVFDIASEIWTAGGGQDMLTAASFFASTQAGPYLYAVGGFSGDLAHNVDQTQRYNMATNQWEIGPTFTSARALGPLAVTSSHLYMLGGDLDGGTESDATDLVEELDLSVWPGGSWTDFGDPLPEINIYPASTCSEVLTGGEIWSVGGGYVNDVGDIILYDTNLYRPSEPCADFYFGDLGPESMATSGFRGETVTYTLSIHNDGTQPDTFSISTSFIWNTTYPPTVGPLGPGESAELLVSVEVPVEASPGESDIALVTATSQGNPNALDAATLVTTAFTEWVGAESIPFGVAFYGFAQCVDEPDVFYVVGSYPGETYFFSYDARVNGWTTLPSFPIPINRSGVVCYDGLIYAAGGDSSGAVDTLYIYDFVNDWSPAAPMPHPLKQAAIGVWDGKIYLVGGTSISLPWTPFNHVDVYDIASATWSDQAREPMPEASSSAGYAQVGPYLYIVGGFSGNFNNNVSATQRYDMSTDTWETGPAFTSARAAFDLVATGSHLYAVGGDADGGSQVDATDLVESLDLSTWPSGAWVDITDPLPVATEGNAGFCSESVSGGEIWSIGGTDGSILLAGTYYRPADPCVSYGVDLPAPWGDFREAGTTAEYLVTITNTGVVTDYYTLDVSTTWNIESSSGGPGPIGPGERLQIVIAVDIPAGTPRGDQGVTEITAASISNPAAMDTTIITTTVGLRDFDLLPISPIHQEDHPGNVLTYTLQVSNIGDFVDSYSVEISATWETTASLTFGPLLPGEEGELLVVVTIPQDAVTGDWDDAVVTLSSQAKPSVTHTVNLTSSVVWHRMFMPLALKN